MEIESIMNANNGIYSKYEQNLDQTQWNKNTNKIYFTSPQEIYFATTVTIDNNNNMVLFVTRENVVSKIYVL